MKKYKIDEVAKRIDMFDERWYKVQSLEGEFDLRSVTTFLEVYPKGYYYDEWLQSLGANSKIALQQAADFGSSFHYLVEQFLKGEEVKFVDGNILLWERFLIWHSWWKGAGITYKQDMVEKILYCLTLQTAGTIDLVTNIDGKAVIFDWKTGKYIYRTSELQLSVYSYLVKEYFNLDYYPKAFIGWFPEKKPNKNGYRIVEIKNIEENLIIFKANQIIYFDNKPNESPKYKSYPISLKLNEEIK